MSLVAETRRLGAIGVEFYKRYLKSMKNIALFAPFLFVFTVMETYFPSGFKNLLSMWSEGRSFFKETDTRQTAFIFLVFILFGFVVRAISWTSNLVFLANGARYLHNKMISSLGATRVTFFDEHSSGRLIRRFSGDYENLTKSIPNYFTDILAATIEITWIIVLILMQAPMVLFACVPCAFIYYRVQKIYRPATRELQRLTKVLETPVWALFTEALPGIQTIRTFNRQNVFLQRLANQQRLFGHALLAQSRLTRWLNLRLKGVSELFAFAVTLSVIVAMHQGVLTIGIAGFLMSLTLGLEVTMQWLTRAYSMLESAMVSVERVLEYQDLTPENSRQKMLVEAPAAWPQRGAIEWKGYKARYRQDSPLILDIDLKIQAGQKIGIIGRTGSGKSSLFQSLFRMLHHEEGQILIDGIDIHTLDLNAVRKVFGIIPQDPLLFSGSLRYNLDRLQQYSDNEIWQALEISCMAEMVRSLPGQLNYTLAERGANLSQGQRQLLCLTRAVLTKAQIVLMDEATASVDPVTEGLIHQAISQSFAGKTLLMIAHRLQTVTDCDELIVVEQGKIRDQCQQNSAGFLAWYQKLGASQEHQSPYYG